MALAPKQISKYREILLERRSVLLGQVASLAKDVANCTEATEISKSPLNPAEIASDNYEQDFAFITMESEEGLVRKIDNALLRIREGTYGTCDECNTVIKKERLDALPFADLCVKCQEQEELGLLSRRSDDEFEMLEDDVGGLSAGDDS